MYSIDGNDVEDADGDTNMLYTDGQSPSEFDYITDTYPDGRDVDSQSEESSSESESNSRFESTGCTDTNSGTTDSYGDGCEWYTWETYQECGFYDDSDFDAVEMCCSCGGGCLDEETDEVDENGYGCAYYSSVPTACGEYDTSDFEAEELCCAC